MKAIKISLVREVVLSDIWYDDQWFEQLIADGWTEEGALREMLREAYREDFSSLWEELLTESGTSYAEVFADSCKVSRVEAAIA